MNGLGDNLPIVIKYIIREGESIQVGVEQNVEGRSRAIDRAIDRAKDKTKQRLAVLLKAIITDEGQRNPDYQKITKLGSESTLKRYLDQLREIGFIEFQGTASQTGGYFVTDKLKKLIRNNSSLS